MLLAFFAYYIETVNKRSILIYGIAGLLLGSFAHYIPVFKRYWHSLHIYIETDNKDFTTRLGIARLTVV